MAKSKIILELSNEEACVLKGILNVADVAIPRAIEEGLGLEEGMIKQIAGDIWNSLPQLET